MGSYLEMSCPSTKSEVNDQSLLKSSKELGQNKTMVVREKKNATFRKTKGTGGFLWMATLIEINCHNLHRRRIHFSQEYL